MLQCTKAWVQGSSPNLQGEASHVVKRYCKCLLSLSMTLSLLIPFCLYKKVNNLKQTKYNQVLTLFEISHLISSGKKQSDFAFVLWEETFYETGDYLKLGTEKIFSPSIKNLVVLKWAILIFCMRLTRFVSALVCTGSAHILFTHCL